MSRSFFLVGSLLLAFVTASQGADAQQQSTTGDCSPIVSDVRGDVSIRCTILANRIPVYRFQGTIDKSTTSTFAKFVMDRKDEIIELDIAPDSEGENDVYFISKNSEQKEMISIYDKEDWDDPASGGQIFNIISDNIVWANGGYVVRGYYYVEELPGIHQGFVEIALIQLSKGEVLSRGRLDRR